MPELDEWKKLAETDDKLAEPEPSARPTPGTDLASKALAATGLGEVVDISQVCFKQRFINENRQCAYVCAFRHQDWLRLYMTVAQDFRAVSRYNSGDVERLSPVSFCNRRKICRIGLSTLRCKI